MPYLSSWLVKNINMNKIYRIPLLICMLSFSVSVFAQYDPLADTISFETDNESININNTPGNIWQRGIPQKTLFNASFDGLRAMVTDTAAPYTSNNTSSFTFVMKDAFTEECYTSFSFWHRYDMDTLQDYGMLEASYDGGDSWIEMRDTVLYNWGFSQFWWDNDFHLATSQFSPHKLRITGTSDGWVQSTYNWIWYLAVKESDTIIINPESLMIRFTFISDSIDDQREGWMIDQLITRMPAWYDCTGVKDLEAESTCSVYPNPVHDRATVRIAGKIAGVTLPGGNTTVGTISGITTGNTNGVTLILSNAYGSVVYEQLNIHESEIPLYFNDLPAGLYVLQIIDKGRIIASKKLIHKV